MSAEPIKTGESPSTVQVVLYDIEHVLDLDACRAAMLYRVAELRAKHPDRGGRELIAEAADVDVQTLRKFLNGERVIAESLIDIVERGLGLKLIDVIKPAKVA